FGRLLLCPPVGGSSAGNRPLRDALRLAGFPDTGQVLALVSAPANVEKHGPFTAPWGGHLLGDMPHTRLLSGARTRQTALSRAIFPGVVSHPAGAPGSTAGSYELLLSDDPTDRPRNARRLGSCTHLGNRSIALADRR